MLERLTGGHPAEPLRVLADASEAQGHGDRVNATSLTPLNRFVDAVPPESESVRAMELAAARFVRNPEGAGDAAFLREQFTRWARNDERFQPLAQRNVFLEELRSLSQDLAALGRAGLEVMDAIARGQKAPEGIALPDHPHAEVVLAAFRPVKLLLEAGR
jgi:hexosaminidase